MQPPSQLRDRDILAAYADLPSRSMLYQQHASLPQRSDLHASMLNRFQPNFQAAGQSQMSFMRDPLQTAIANASAYRQIGDVNTAAYLAAISGQQQRMQSQGLLSTRMYPMSSNLSLFPQMQAMTGVPGVSYPQMQPPIMAGALPLPTAGYGGINTLASVSNTEPNLQNSNITFADQRLKRLFMQQQQAIISNRYASNLAPANLHHHVLDPSILTRGDDFAREGLTEALEDTDLSDKATKQWEKRMETRSSVGKAELKRRKAPTFPEKLMKAMLAFGEEDAVAWLQDNKSFVVVAPDLFNHTVLRKVFKKSKYSSFVRKLNRWGFIRLTAGTGTDCFHHPLFRRDKPELASTIKCLPRNERSAQKNQKRTEEGKDTQSEDSDSMDNEDIEDDVEQPEAFQQK